MKMVLKIIFIILFFLALTGCEKLPPNEKTDFNMVITGYFAPDGDSSRIYLSGVDGPLSDAELRNTILLIDFRNIVYTVSNSDNLHRNERMIKFKYPFENNGSYTMKLSGTGNFRGGTVFTIPGEVEVKGSRDDHASMLVLEWNEVENASSYAVAGMFYGKRKFENLVFEFDEAYSDKENYGFGWNLRNTSFKIDYETIRLNVQDYYNNYYNNYQEELDSIVFRVYAVVEDAERFWNTEYYDFTNLEGNCAGILTGVSYGEYSWKVEKKRLCRKVSKTQRREF